MYIRIKLMNRFSYYITTYFIPNNKNYKSCRNPHSVYQTYPYKLLSLHLTSPMSKTFMGGSLSFPPLFPFNNSCMLKNTPNYHKVLGCNSTRIMKSFY